MTEEEYTKEYESHYIRLGKALRCRFRFNDDQLEDFNQEAWLRAWKHRNDWKRDSSFYTYVFRIAVNVVLTHIRRSDVRTRYTMIYRPEIITYPKIDKEMDYQAVLDKVLGAFNENTIEYNVMHSYYVDGDTFEEIGTKLERSTMSCRMIAFRSRNKVRAQFT